MIKYNDVRIGNKIYDGQNIVDVDGVDIYGNLLTEDRSYDDGYKKIENPEGIELTEEWLRKFGFEGINQNDNLWSYFQLPNKKGVSFWIEQNQFGVFEIHYGGYVKDMIVKYVHKLQNIYFDFTGEELVIKT